MEDASKKVSVQTPMEHSDVDALDEMARKARLSRAALVRQILGRAIESYKKKTASE